MCDRLKGCLALLMAALLALAPVRALAWEAAEAGESLYMENEWNFVDGSMDITAGIPENAEGVLGDIRERGVLRVATEPYFAPQEFIDPDKTGQEQYVGADMELARLIAGYMGVELEIVPMDFSEVLNAVSDGRCDLAISALAYTPGRASRMTLSKGYNFGGENSGSGLMIRAADSEAITGIEALRDRNIAAQSGSLQEALMAENVFRYREFRRMQSIQDVYQALMDGRVDAAMVDVDSGMSFIHGNPECALMFVPDIRFKKEAQFDGDRIAAKKDEFQLICFVNGVIDEVLESGAYRAWFDEYGVRASELGL